VLYPRATHNAANKEKLFPSSFWGIFDFFLFFFDDKGILRYNGGTSTANIQAQDTRARLMFWEVILGKILQWPKVLRRRNKRLQG
jgi:hypothetical protein